MRQNSARGVTDVFYKMERAIGHTFKMEPDSLRYLQSI